ncbi:MAG: hypothetical protein ACRD12_02390 [Acidimicrobiales bacterium]
MVPTTQPPALAGSGYGAPQVVGTIADPAVVESSGLVASRHNAGLYWTHNDSGDDPFLYCLQPSGDACGVWQVTGASARDWEDIAAGPGPEAGRTYLYVGEIGDNLVDQDPVTVYRVPEPGVPRIGSGPTRAAPAATEAAEALRLRYPDGPHNAEALAVHPQTGDVYIVAKEANPGVYVARAPLRSGTTTTMEKVATLPIGQSNRTQATGADISPDGTRVAIAAYSDGYELRLPPGASSFDAVWQQPPVRIALGQRVQGEAIAYRLDGNALLTTTERPGGFSGPIHEIQRV